MALPSFEVKEISNDLKVWSESHKNRLKEVIDYNLSEERAELLIDAINRDNSFLNDPAVLQDTASDEEWTYDMHETINNLISQHPNGFQIEVMSSTCKQLTCELLINERVGGSWVKIYISLVKHFLSLRFNVQSEDMKQFRFENGDTTIFYQHLVFSEL